MFLGFPWKFHQDMNELCGEAWSYRFLAKYLTMSKMPSLRKHWFCNYGLLYVYLSFLWHNKGSNVNSSGFSSSPSRVVVEVVYIFHSANMNVWWKRHVVLYKASFARLAARMSSAEVKPSHVEAGYHFWQRPSCHGHERLFYVPCRCHSSLSAYSDVKCTWKLFVNKQQPRL